MQRTYALAIFVCLLSSLVAASVRPAAGAVARVEPASTGAGQAVEVLGFRLGEERHYLLGPAELLEPGEEVRWSIALREVSGAGSGVRATFGMRHERTAPRSLEAPWVSGQVTHVIVDGTLTVNQHGAPLAVDYTSQRHIYDIGDEIFQVDYRYDGDKYEKRVSLQGSDWDVDIDILEHANVDAEVPIGLFAFAPTSLECIEWHAGIILEQRTGTGDVTPDTVQPADRQGRAVVEGATLAGGGCNETNTDPAFANPGLASLAMPLLWELRGDSELVLFSPLRPDLVRGQGNGIPLTFTPAIPIPVPGGSILSGALPGFDLGAMLGGGGTAGDKERARNPARYFFPRRLELSDRERIDIGRRKVEALPLDIGGYAGRVWIDDWGKVVRMDVPPLRHGDPQRWIRLLQESEY